MTYSTPALILRRRDVGEWDRLYTAYTRDHGKLSLLGKGTRRPRAKLTSHLEPYAEVDLTIARGKTIDRITFARTIRSGQALATSYEHAYTAAYLAECVDQLTRENHRDVAIYDLLRDAFNTILQFLPLSQRGSDLPASLREALRAGRGWDAERTGRAACPPAFEPARLRGGGGAPTSPGELEMRNWKLEILTPFTIRLLSILGYAPALDRCIECHDVLPEGPMVGVPLRGGIACPSCAVSMRDGINLSEVDRQQLAAAVASFRPFEASPAVADFTRVALGANLWQPLRTDMPPKSLTGADAARTMATS